MLRKRNRIFEIFDQMKIKKRLIESGFEPRVIMKFPAFEKTIFRKTQFFESTQKRISSFVIDILSQSKALTWYD